jgi:hypothetical protein
MIYSVNSSSLSGHPAATISSPRNFIVPKYSVMVRLPFRVVPKANRVFTVRAHVCDANMDWISFQAAAAVVHKATCWRMSLERDANR